MIVAPASTAAWLLSICSLTEIGRAGLFALRGTDPVIAQHRMQGLPAMSDIEDHRFCFAVKIGVMVVTGFYRLCDLR